MTDVIYVDAYYDAKLRALGDDRYDGEFGNLSFTLRDTATSEQKATRSHGDLFREGHIKIEALRVSAGVKAPVGFHFISSGHLNFAPFNQAICEYTKTDPRKIAIQKRIDAAQEELKKAQTELEAL